MTDIQIGSRLVEYDDLRLLTDRARQKYALPLAVADCLERPLREFQCIYGGERLFDLSLILFREKAQSARVGIAPHRDHVAAGHLLRLQPSGENDRHFPRELHRRKLCQVFHGRIRPRPLGGKINTAPDRDKLAGDGL